VDRAGSRLDIFFAEAPPMDPLSLAALVAAWPGAKLGSEGKTLSVPLPPGPPLENSGLVLQRLGSAKMRTS
jgi:hypothetical protein